MKALFALLISFFTLAAIAQVPQANVLSLQGYGGNGDDQIGTAVTTTTDGGFIIQIASTSAYGTGNLDSFCTLSGDRSVFLKYSVNATTLEWSLCTTNGSYLFPIDSGNFILGGITDPSSGWAFKMIKQNSSGSIIWEKTFGDSAEAILKNMTATIDGGYIMIGETYYTNVDFPIHYGSNLVEDIGLIKVDSSGNKLWSKVIGGTLSDVPASVIAAPDGGCYITGTTASNDYDCTGNHGGASGSSDAYLVRLDMNGNIMWHKDLGGTGYDGGDGAWPDGNGGVIIGGNTNSHDGDVSHYVGGFWALDVDSSGNILWNNSYGNGGAESPSAICKAADGTIWIAGTSGTQGGEIDTAYGNTDAWFVHTDGGGNFLSAKVLGGSGQDKGQMIYPLSAGGVIAGGYYSVNNSAFSSLLSYGATDAFIAIFAPWPESVQQINSINSLIKIYPNPTNDMVTVETIEKDNYSVVITDVLGRAIYTTSLTDRVQINVNDWQPGMYYVQVLGSDRYRNVQKLMVR